MKFTKFLKEYQKQLKSASGVYASKHSIIDKDDLYQEAQIVLLYLYLKGLTEENNSFERTLWWEVRKCFQRYIKRELYRAMKLVSLDTDRGSLEQNKGYNPIETLIGAKGVDEGTILIEEIRGKLNKQEGVVLDMRIQGYNYREIGNMLSMSKTSVCRVCENIKKKL